MEESRELPVVLVLIADWLGASEMLDTYIEDLAPKYYPAIKFYRQDIQKNKQIVARLGIRNLPNTLIFKDGEIVDSFAGALSKRKIQAKLDQL